MLPLFPSALILIGAYLVFRGWSVKNSPMEAVSGTATAIRPITNTFSGIPCVYRQLTLEYFDSKSDWKVFSKSVESVPFSIGEKSIDASKAEVRLIEPQIWTGYISQNKGTIQEFQDNLKNTPPGKLISSILSKSPFSSGNGKLSILPPNIVSALNSKPETSIPLQKHQKQAIRVSEYLIAIDQSVFVLGDPTKKASNSIKAIAISNQNADAVKTIIKEKAFISISVGISMIVVGLLLFVFFG